MEQSLQIENLTNRYPGFCLDNLSFSVPKGTIVGLIGENGAGKTTTIKLILHAAEKDSGEVFVFGKDHLAYEREIKQDIGVVQDECNLPMLFTASDMEAVMKKIYKNWDHAQYWALIEKFNLPRNQMLSSFSKGMKVKMNFAIALAHKSKLLLLDEATSGLDPVMRDDVLDLLLEFVQNEEHSVLFSSHITNDLSKIADYIAFLHAGKLLFYQAKDDLIYHYGLVHYGDEQFRRFEKNDMLAWRKQDYEYQILVADRDAVSRKYQGCVIDPATLDDIMLLYIRGERMIGLMTKDFLVLNREFHRLYKLLCAALLVGVIVLLPEKSAMYIGLLLPVLGVSFLTELIRVEEKSDWKEYLPALPVTSREIVLSRYLFCGILLAALSIVSLVSCMVAPLISSITLADAMFYLISGVWFAVLMLSFGIPCGYFFKNKIGTGAMLWAIAIYDVIHNTGVDTLLFRLAAPVIYAAVIAFTTLMVYVSYRLSLWIYTRRRYAKQNTSQIKRTPYNRKQP